MNCVSGLDSSLKATLAGAQPGLMRGVLLGVMSLVQDRSLDLLSSMGSIRNKIHLISPGCPPAQYSLTSAKLWPSTLFIYSTLVFEVWFAEIATVVYDPRVVKNKDCGQKIQVPGKSIGKIVSKMMIFSWNFRPEFHDDLSEIVQYQPTCYSYGLGNGLVCFRYKMKLHIMDHFDLMVYLQTVAKYKVCLFCWMKI